MKLRRYERKDEISRALSVAQREIKGAETLKENTFTKSKYADLTAVWNAVRDALSRNGLAVTQVFEGTDPIILVTTLLHDSGQSISSAMPLNYVKDWHSLGSAATYARRYSLAALVGCAPEGEDDDGNLAQHSGRTPPPSSRKNYPKRKISTTPSPSIPTEIRTQEIIKEVKEADEWLRNQEIDPGDPPKAVQERIVKLGPDGLRKKIADAKKKAKKLEALQIVAEADRVESVEEESK